MQYLFRTLSLLQRKQGPVLFQFPAGFREDAEALQDFLDLIPQKILCAFEFRHPSWKSGRIQDLLRARNLSLCTADTDDLPAQDILATASWGYLRLRRSGYADADLASWLKKIHAQQWKTVFVFFKHEEEARGPELAMRFGKMETEASWTAGGLYNETKGTIKKRINGLSISISRERKVRSPASRT